MTPGGAGGPDERVIAVRDLHMRYGTRDVLDGVQFEVRRGEVICLLGPNGAGKTTTIEILEGFRVRTSGDVRVLGADPSRADEDWRARTGVVLQSWRDHPRWTSRRLLTQLGGYYAPYATSDVARPFEVEALLDMVGLRELADQKTATLSGGQRRRLDVAVGIVGRPELLFLWLLPVHGAAGAGLPLHPPQRRGRGHRPARPGGLVAEHPRRPDRVRPGDRSGLHAGDGARGRDAASAQGDPVRPAALEIGGSWRPLETVLVLAAWAVVGWLVTPTVLRRMARRQSGSQVQAARDAALQWIR